jgi:glutathione synthase/RimK-type ligase-like ATP-grasp enzyme
VSRAARAAGRGPVLLFTHSGDYDVPDFVAAALARRGAKAIRVDTDRFPAEGALTLTSDTHGLGAVLSLGDDEIDLLRCAAVWSRRIWTAALPLDVDPAFAAACRAQARDALAGALALLEEEVPVVNRLAPQLRAEHKVLQLRAARAAGLSLPPTLITNEPAAARAFVEEHGAVVTKMLVPLSQTMDGSGPFVYTSPVDEEDLADAEGLRSAPMIFQARVEKSYEVRAIVVDKRVFAAAVDPGALDWRLGAGGEWRELSLPRAVERAAVRLVESLGLVTGALDFIVDERGAHAFLEINPAGEWGWLQKELGLPIAEAIAGALLRSHP